MDTGNAVIASRMKRTNKERRTRRNESVKVVYISTPMKVTTSASKFKPLVQQLTGKHSDICGIMDTNGTTDFEVFPDDDVPAKHSLLLSVMDSGREYSATTTATSESLAEHLDDEQLQEMFPFDLFLDLNSSDLEVDVLCSSYAM